MCMLDVVGVMFPTISLPVYICCNTQFYVFCHDKNNNITHHSFPCLCSLVEVGTTESIFNCP